MTNKLLAQIAGLSDGQLLDGARGLAHRERLLTAELVAHLAELDRRGAVLREGYSCLFVYCRDALGLSEGEAYNRASVAEAARQYPAIVDALLHGDVSLTAIRLVRPHLTADNHAAVLQSLRGRKKSEVEQVVAALAPRPEVPTVLRKLPAPRPAAIARPTVPVARPVITAPDRYRLQVTLDGDSVATLEKLKDLLRHAVPSGDAAEIVRRALAALLAQTERKTSAASELRRSTTSRCAAARTTTTKRAWTTVVPERPGRAWPPTHDWTARARRGPPNGWATAFRAGAHRRA